MSRLTYYLVPAERWAALDHRPPYSAPSLETEGFIHCTDGAEAIIAVERLERLERDATGEFIGFAPA